jgi:hypothetical protein
MPLAKQIEEINMTKKEEILAYLHEHVFDPILNSPTASETLKKGVLRARAVSLDSGVCCSLD